MSPVSNSLDAFVDVLGDWFIEIWGQRIAVYVKGSSILEKIGPRTLAEIVQCCDYAFDSAAREMIRLNGDCEYLEEKNKISIWLCFN